MSLPQVTTIGRSAFSGCTALQSAELPQVTTIGQSAFSDCTALESAELPLVTTLEERTFYNCGALKRVTLPQVTTIGRNAFYNCRALESPEFGEVTSIEDQAFGCCEALTDFDFSAVTTIGKYAFSDAGLTGELDLSSVVTIGENAFESCSGIESVTFGRGLEGLASNAFGWCTALKKAVFFGKCVNPKNNSGPVYDSAFRGCSDYTIYYYPLFSDGGENMVPMESDETLFSGTFYEEGFVWSLSADGTLTVTGSGATPDVDAASGEWRDYSSRIRRIVIGEGITRLGSRSFRSDYGHRLGAEAGCVLILPEGLEEIGESCFDAYSTGYSRVSSVVFPSTLKTIGARAFYSCSALKSVSLPQVTELGGDAFYSCSALESVTAPRMTTIGSSAFYNCDALKTVSMPQLRTVGSSAFNACGALESTEFGAVTVIESGAFNGCTALKRFDFSTVESIGQNAFYRTGLTGELDLSSVTTIASYAFRGCGGLSVSFGENLTSLGYYAFDNCSELTAYFCYDNCPGSSGISSSAFSSCTDCVVYYYPIFSAGGENMVPMESDEEFLSGTFYEEGFRWSLNKNAILTVTGSGAIPDVDAASGEWRNYADRIRGIVIGEGITRLGRNCFQSSYNRRLGAESGCTLVLPEGLEEIGKDCFSDSRISSVSFPSTLRVIEENAFYSNQKLSELSLRSGIGIGVNAFRNVRPVTLTLGEGCILNTLNISELKTATLPPDFSLRETSIEGGSGDRSETTIRGYDGTDAQTLAETYGMRFESLGTAVQKKLLVTQDETLKDLENVYYADADGRINVDDLMKCVRNNTRVVFDDGVYRTNRSITLDRLVAVTLCAENPGRAEILAEVGGVPVVEIKNCRGVGLEGLLMGHRSTSATETYIEGCWGDYSYTTLSSGHVVRISGSRDVTVDNCDLWGCGVIAVYVTTSDGLTVRDSVLRDCIVCAVYASSTRNACFENCVISGNRKDNCPSDYYWACVNPSWSEGDMMRFTGCRFLNNRNDRLLPEDPEAEEHVTMENCFFQNNAWDDGAPMKNGVCWNTGITWEIEAAGNSEYDLYLGRDLRFDDGSTLKSGKGEVPVYSDYSLPWKKWDTGDHENIHVFLADGVTLSWCYQHKWGEPELTQEPTCGSRGTLTYTCSVCGSEKTESVEATGEHVWDEGVEMADHTLYTCTVCHRTMKDDLHGTCGKNGSSLTWSLSKGTLTISGEGEMMDYAGDYNGGAWYAYREQITRVAVEEGVTSLGRGAFVRCTALEEVSLPDSLLTISEQAFQYCGRLKTVTIPAGVRTIFGNSFFLSAEAFAAAPGNPNFKAADGALLSADGTKLVAYPGGRKDSGWRVPDGVTEIGESAICSEALRELDLNRVRYLNRSAICCYNMEKLTIPKSLTKMEDGALSLNRLSEFIVESGNPAFKAADGVLFTADGTTLIRYPAQKSERSYAVPEGTELLSYGAFNNNAQLVSLTLPKSLLRLENYSIEYCGSLSSVTFLGDAPAVQQTQGGSQTRPIYNSAEGCRLYCSNETVGWTELAGYSADAGTIWGIPAVFSGEAHHWVGTVTKAAGCEEKGEMRYVCTDEGCGTEHIRVTAPNGHCYVTRWVSAAAGEAERRQYICAGCGDVYFTDAEADEPGTLPRGEMPSDLVWDEDDSTGSPVKKTGCISFSAPAAGRYYVVVYRSDSTQQVCYANVTAEAAGRVSTDILLQQALTTGQYRFIVQHSQEWNVSAESEFAVSDLWSFTQPEETLKPCLSVTMNGREAVWEDSDDAGPCAGYQISLYRSYSASDDPETLSAYTTEFVEAGTNSWAVPANMLYSGGDFYVSVSRVSADISAAASSGKRFSERTRLEAVTDLIYVNSAVLEMRRAGGTVEIIAYPSEAKKAADRENGHVLLMLQQDFTDVLLPETLIRSAAEADCSLQLWSDNRGTTRIDIDPETLGGIAAVMGSEDRITIRLDAADGSGLTAAQRAAVGADDVLLELSFTVEHYENGVLTGTEELHELRGEVEAQLPYSEPGGSGAMLTLARIDPDGSTVYVPVDELSWSGTMRFKVGHLSLYRLRKADEVSGMLGDVSWSYRREGGEVSVDLPGGDRRKVYAAFYSSDRRFVGFELLTAERNSVSGRFGNMELMLVDENYVPQCASECFYNEFVY